MSYHNQKVTILMACFNSARFIGEAIESVLHQTHDNFEFFIIDDGSSDNTVALCREYAKRDRRIRLFPLPKNGGCPKAINFGLQHVTTEWILRFDPDDVMMPSRIERQLSFLEEHPELSVASSQAILIDAKGLEIGRSRSPYITAEAVAAVVEGPALLGFHHPATIIKTSAIREVGGYRPQYWLTDDLDLWARLTEAGHLILVQNECLIKYRHHASSITFASNSRQVLAIDWSEDSKARRRAHQPELSFEEFLQQRRDQWIGARINQYRRLLGRTLYKAGLLHYAMGQLYRATAKILIGGLLQPTALLPRLWKRLRPGTATTPTVSPNSAKTVQSPSRRAA